MTAHPELLVGQPGQPARPEAKADGESSAVAMSLERFPGVGHVRNASRMSLEATIEAASFGSRGSIGAVPQPRSAESASCRAALSFAVMRSTSTST